MSTAAIETYDLSTFYGKIRGIDALDLRVERGEVFGFLGPNGAGKTTTIRLLLDLLLAQPLRRVDLVLQRFLALTALVLILALTLLVTVALGSWLVDLHIGFDKLAAASGGVALLAMRLEPRRSPPARSGLVAGAPLRWQLAWQSWPGCSMGSDRPSTASNSGDHSRPTTKPWERIRLEMACPGEAGRYCSDSVRSSAPPRPSVSSAATSAN